MPPSTNTDFQPKWLIRLAAATPPSAAPSEKPQNMIMIVVARIRFGAYSVVSAIALGIAPPRPRPVMKRRMISDCTESAVEVSRDITPKNKVQKMRTGLRPKRSATGPKASAPSMRPKSPAENTGVSAARSTCHERTMAGAT